VGYFKQKILIKEAEKVIEEEWLNRIRSGDESALKEVYLKYNSEFLVWIANLNGFNSKESSEVYHLTMLAFFENVKRGKLTTLSSQLKTYIFGIGKNKAKEFKRLYRVKSVSLDALGFDYPSEEPQLAENNNGLLSILKKGLQKLGNPCRSLLEAFYLDGLSMEEISKTFDYKSATVAKTQKYKCIQRLKKIVAKE